MQKKKILYYILPVLSILTILLIWIAVSSYNEYLMPSPSTVWERFVMTLEKPIKKTSMLGHTWASLKRVLTALIFSWTLGIAFGVMMGWNRKFKAIFGTIFEFLRPIPPIAWIPLIIMWFGIGEFSKIIIVFIGTFPNMVINSASGIRLVDKINVDVGRVFNGNSRQILFEIVIPTALPSIFAGIRTSVGGGWLVVLAAEMLGAERGLGFLVTRGWEAGDISLVVVSIIFIGMVGAILSIVTGYIERRLCPWNVKQTS